MAERREWRLSRRVSPLRLHLWLRREAEPSCSPAAGGLPARAGEGGPETARPAVGARPIPSARSPSLCLDRARHTR